MKEFFVVRLCNKNDGTVAAPVASYETEPEAQKEFFRQCGHMLHLHLESFDHLETHEHQPGWLIKEIIHMFESQ